MSAVLLEIAVLGVGQLRRVAEAIDREPGDRELVTDEPAGGAFDGFKHVVRSRFLSSIVGYVLCTACAATFVYLAQQEIAHGSFGKNTEASADYFSTVDLCSNIGVLIVQTLVAAPLLRRFGPGIVLCILPIAQLAGVSWLVIAPSLTALAIVAVVTRTATHGLTRPSRELLFTVVSRDDKYRAKNVIDTMVYRFGDWIASWIVLAGVGATAMIAVTVPLVLVWTTLATVLGAGFRRRLKEA
jgi:AAA family ATP:ADP antiporter